MSVAVATALLPLAGCSVASDGQTGVTVDGQGNWLIVLAWYCRRPDSVILYHHNPSSSEDAGSVTDAKLDPPAVEATATPPAHQVITMTVDLLHPPSDWTVRQAAQPLDPSVTYSAYSGTKDNSWSTGAVDFQLGDIDELAPGQVLYYSAQGKNFVGSMDDFEKDAARDHRC